MSMKVKELVAALKAMPQESKVAIHVGLVLVQCSGTLVNSGNVTTIFTKHAKELPDNGQDSRGR